MKKTIRLYVIFFMVLILFLISIRHGADVFNRSCGGTVVEDCLDYAKKDDGGYTASYQLPQDTEGLYAVFSTHHFQCRVLVGDEVVYEVNMKDNRVSRSAGYRMNLIELRKEDSGKTMTLELYSPYDGSKPEKEIYIGHEVDIYNVLIKENLMRMSLAVIILFAGVLLLVYSVFFAKLKHADVSIIHFSVFCISLALWAMLETPLSSLVQDGEIERMVLDHYMLMMMPMSFALYVRSNYRKKSQMVWTGCFYLLLGVMVIRTILQLFVHIDLKETLYLTQGSIVIFALIGLALTILEVVQKNVSRRLKINLICIVIIMVATASELGYYYIGTKSPAFGMIGFLVYVLVIACDLMQNTRRQLAIANKAADYRKMAYRDDLTGIYSRTAFHKHMREFDEYVRVNQGNHKKTVALIIFDLNNLKECNDTYGHEYGDRYLVEAANAINETFGDAGSCYRIGGDEFSVLMLYRDEEQIQQLLELLEQRMQQLNENGFVVHASVASGYAVFDKELDDNLEQTMVRADAMMYERKKRMKMSR